MEEFGPGGSLVCKCLFTGQSCSASGSEMIWAVEKIPSKGWPWSELSLFRLQALLQIAGAGTAAIGTC